MRCRMVEHWTLYIVCVRAVGVHNFGTRKHRNLVTSQLLFDRKWER